MHVGRLDCAGLCFENQRTQPISSLGDTAIPTPLLMAMHVHTHAAMHSLATCLHICNRDMSKVLYCTHMSMTA